MQERERERERHDLEHFSPGEKARHEQAQRAIKQMYAALTAGQELAEGPTAPRNMELKLDHWFKPIHVEDRVAGDEAFAVSIQLGDSAAMCVLRSWFDIYEIVDGVAAASPRETVIYDYIAWPDSEPSKIAHESTLTLEAKLRELIELQQTRAAPVASASA